jgi:hypothetical protein
MLHDCRNLDLHLTQTAILFDEFDRDKAGTGRRDKGFDSVMGV